MKVLVVDNHPIVASGCRLLFERDDDVEIREAKSAMEGEAAYLSDRPDVAIVDVDLPDQSGFALTQSIVGKDENARVIIFTMSYDAMFAARSLESGARGYLSKNHDPEQLRSALFRVAQGEIVVPEEFLPQVATVKQLKASGGKAQLRERDLSILRLLADGATMAEIAVSLDLSYKTIGKECARMRTLFGAANQLDLLQRVLREGRI